MPVPRLCVAVGLRDLITSEWECLRENTHTHMKYFDIHSLCWKQNNQLNKPEITSSDRKMGQINEHFLLFTHLKGGRLSRLRDGKLFQAGERVKYGVDNGRKIRRKRKSSPMCS